MTNEEKLLVKKARLNQVIAKGNIHDCPGVERKLRRQVRNLEKAINKE